MKMAMSLRINKHVTFDDTTFFNIDYGYPDIFTPSKINWFALTNFNKKLYGIPGKIDTYEEAEQVLKRFIAQHSRNTVKDTETVLEITL